MKKIALFLSFFLFGIFLVPVSYAANTLSITGGSSCTAPCQQTLTWTTDATITIAIDQQVTYNGSTSTSAVNTSGQMPNGSAAVTISQGTNVFKLYVDGGAPTTTLTYTGGTSSSPTNTPTPGPTNTPTPGPTATPAPRVYTVKYCNQDCSDTNSTCDSGLSCINVDGTKKCRRSTDPTNPSCPAPGTATATPAPASNTTLASSNTSGSRGGSAAVTPAPTGAEENVLGTESAQMVETTPAPTGEVKAAAANKGGNDFMKKALLSLIGVGIVISGVFAFKMSTVSSSSKLKKTIDEMKKINSL